MNDYVHLNTEYTQLSRVYIYIYIYIFIYIYIYIYIKLIPPYLVSIRGIQAIHTVYSSALLSMVVLLETN